MDILKIYTNIYQIAKMFENQYIYANIYAILKPEYYSQMDNGGNEYD